ncbi:uncharacterized protein [Palaemon carinicauda]|uniref:uncharacterized protein n=1 Tax=Palaemon carinicauda TaxID=392227 RepID=UPI0035B5C313
MPENGETAVRCAVGTTEWFNVDVGLHQELALGPILLIFITDIFTDGLEQESPSSMLYSHSIAISEESYEEVKANLEIWWYALERKVMKIHRRTKRETSKNIPQFSMTSVNSDTSGNKDYKRHVKKPAFSTSPTSGFNAFQFRARCTA